MTIASSAPVTAAWGSEWFMTQFYSKFSAFFCTVVIRLVRSMVPGVASEKSHTMGIPLWGAIRILDTFSTSEKIVSRLNIEVLNNHKSLHSTIAHQTPSEAFA